jgi:hypothetical protein
MPTAGSKTVRIYMDLCCLNRPKEFDAYHIAAAETAGCDRVVTCDDLFLKAARRNAGRIAVTVTDPIRLVSEVSF